MDVRPDHCPEAGGASPNEVGLLDAALGCPPAVQDLMSQIAELEAAGLKARQAGDEAGAGEIFQEALTMALDAAERPGAANTRVQILEMATRLALHGGETNQAKRIMAEVMATDATALEAGEWVRFRNITTWPDVWLVAAIRREPPDMTALNTLVKRHWQELFSRCRMLTLHQANADDLAQDVWRRVLKGRERLAPGRNFIGYLITIATNLWRDSLRAARRAGPLAAMRLASLDAAVNFNEDEEITLLEILPDLKDSAQAERKIMADEIDEAMGGLTPSVREVLVARYLDGESCAEIGKRHGCTEQTIRNWLRGAVSEIKQKLEERLGPPAERKD